jgi:hypothetical protein
MPAADREYLLARFGDCVGECGGIPTQSRFIEFSGLGRGRIAKLMGGWAAVPPAFVAWAACRPEFATAAAAVEAQLPRFLSASRSVPRTRAGPAALLLTDAIELGDPLATGCMCHAPLNEQGVVLQFGALAERLGFRVMSVRQAFPDCVALRRTGLASWQPLRIEFEYESRSFEQHGHDPAGCDLIVCWRDNWEACPLPVLELRRELS